ncbi:NAD-binding Rossmann fold oxidoreductase [Histoplasma capsulatum var. duboisii H88]|uniref:NAD-binding Rossmann fold oxidoreductase n=1 Tax=Ajellomyces capsulatus (strain H88) TaxID=544711 RepID=A0A8A1LUX1_AJEC8|nr:NAD-binding Rossmann fold oxidoreductase [Histoplasma capsulatum var. duboisii H88]
MCSLMGLIANLVECGERRWSWYIIYGFQFTQTRIIFPYRLKPHGFHSNSFLNYTNFSQASVKKFLTRIFAAWLSNSLPISPVTTHPVYAQRYFCGRSFPCVTQRECLLRIKE